MLELLVTKSGKELVAMPMDGDVFRIGRASTNDLSLPDPQVSRHQCLITRTGAGLVLKDQSGHGTLVDGQRQIECSLAVGARLDLGELSVQLREQKDLPAPITTASGGSTAVLDHNCGQVRSLFLCGKRGGKVFKQPLVGEVLAIGSNPSNDVVIAEDYISAFHCRIFRRDGDWHITDLGSTNGTFLNNVRVVEARLAPASQLTLGRFPMTVESDTGEESPDRFCGIVSVDPAMKPIFDMVRRAAGTDETILITGESGSGKELLAQALHRLSQRAAMPMVSLNCAAVTKDLLESELFGHEKGAFTGANNRRKGLFEEADKGTLFLDEIGELHLDMQAKLLRTLENGEVRRVGSNQAFSVDVRVIAATNQPVAARVQKGEFREDLYFRINVIEIVIPPLRKRRNDIPLLADHFLARATRTTSPRQLAPEAIEKLVDYRFPGNVRELKHIITRAAILCSDEVIGPNNLTFAPPSLADRVAESQLYQKGRTLKEVEVDTIKQALQSSDGNQKAAAQILGIARSTLIHKMEKYGISSRDFPPNEN